jgi:photosystem II stability/assembly factor-like uncharacterized protein
MNKYLFMALLSIVIISCSKSNDTSGSEPSFPDNLNGWQLINTDFTGLTDVFFISPAKGFITGKGLYRTLDSGKTWTRIFRNEFFNIQFLDEKYGYTCGPGGIFSFTTDGGSSWDTVVRGPHNPQDIHFLTPSTGFVTSTDGIFKTVDTGHNWQKVASGWGNAIDFAGNTGWVTTRYSGLLKTMDGGNTWSNTSLDFENQHMPFLYNQNTGWVAGDSILYKSTDAGATWKKSSIPKGYHDIQFLNASIGFMTGNKALFRSSNGGDSWEEIVKMNKVDFVELFFLDGNTGWAVGNYDTYPFKGVLLRLKK